MAGLTEYQRKRDFSRSPEPSAEASADRRSTDRFVVQQHAARRLHYDFRLELDGVLKSWAVTRGPSLVPTEKRLAVQTEDHPLAYAGFEGVIPKGSYGAGRVIVWDAGTWHPNGSPQSGLEKGHLRFTLEGHKLKGEWHLVRLKKRQGERTESWLLMKGRDAFARDPDAPDILEEAPRSVLTGRTLDELETEPKRRPDAGARAPPPAFVAPMLAKPATRAPSGSQWVHEVKLDGYRVQARVVSGDVRLSTRSGADWTERFGSRLRDALAALPCQNALLDGELVAESERGLPDFGALAAALGEGRTETFVYYAFDLLHLDGRDLRGEPLLARKEQLARLLGPRQAAPLRYCEHFQEDGERFREHVCRMGLEGVVSKLGTSRYSSSRGGAWVKVKCLKRQEFVIGGFVRAKDGRDAIGSLSLGVPEANGALRYVGRVGTGFNARSASALFSTLSPLARRGPPFEEVPSAERRGVTWVEPRHVAEVQFGSWTPNRLIRHAVYRGVRPARAAPASEPSWAAGGAHTARAARGEGSGPAVKLTNPDRVYWPDAQVTKRMLAEYYVDIWPLIRPHLVRRPLALLRCVEGVDGPRFFQKHPWKGREPSVLALPTGDEAEPEVIVIDDVAGLVALAQSGVLEIHPWGSHADDLAIADRLIMDLDPGDGVEWATLVRAALELRERLAAMGLASFVKATGGKGLHVVAPLAPGAPWPLLKAATLSLARQMAADSPRTYVAVMTKALRHGRIFVDYLRNQRGATAVGAYSTRARPGAPVAMPLRWDELGEDARDARHHLRNARARLDTVGDPWPGFFKLRQRLPGS